MAVSDPNSAACKVLFVTDGNILDDSFESRSQRALFRALLELGMQCEVLCRFLTLEDSEREPGEWLAERGWRSEPAKSPHNKKGDANPITVVADGLPVTLLRGVSTKPHEPNEEERAAFLQVATAQLGRSRPDVVVVRSGLCLADVLAVAQVRSIASVAWHPDSRVRDATPLRAANVVLTPTRFAADYLREAFALPCANLPPVVAGTQTVAEGAVPGSVVFGGTGVGGGMFLFVQLAEELLRRRPNLPLIVLGGKGEVNFSSGGKVLCRPMAELEAVWRSASVLVAPQVSWEEMPWPALSALAHGVPAIVADRGAAAELLETDSIRLPLPLRLTAIGPAPLKPNELQPWVAAVQRFLDDPSFAAGQQRLAVVGSKRYDAATLAPRYAEFLMRLAERHRADRVLGNGASLNGEATALRRLSESHAWPAQQPEDADPGQEQGWLGNGTEVMLARSLPPSTRVVLELGAWLGLSTRFIAEHAPAATVISVDHWRGSPEHHTQERFQKLLPKLYETFQARCWNYRQRIVPLRMSTLDGLRTVAENGVEPDFIYVDAEHSYEAVTAELTLARQLFPRAALGGDDYDWSGVRAAVDGFARRHGMIVDRYGERGWRLLESWQAAEANYPPPGRGQCTVLVPHMNGIEWECEQALRRLEADGVRVVRRGGCSAIDVARNEMLSEALHDGAESIVFIDSDVGFETQDALRLLARPEPVVAGVYAKKGGRALASVFAEGVNDIVFGPDAPALYPLKYAATGFLRIRAEVLRRMIAELRLPLCNTHWCRGVWPFFMPMIISHEKDKLHYLAEDWAFSHRLHQIGVTPLADTSIRLWHWGRYGFSWEDAGSTLQRYRTFNLHLTSV
jgi:hypothetical protein